MTLRDLFIEQGAALAPDGIPLHFGDLQAEYHAALERTVLMNRSHEGRLELTGRDRLSLPHRVSTNALDNLQQGEGRPTIFTNANARILERATLYARGERVLAVTEPGRGQSLLNYLQRNIFFNDDLQVRDLSADTSQFALHGLRADAVMAALVPGVDALPPMHSREAEIGGVPVFVARNKPLAGTHWTLVMASNDAAAVWQAVFAAGQPFGLIPAGSLTYNTLRIRAGRPGVGRELSQEYIPLEVGLWDEISFQKGCYTGQEIIARMESRSRLARVMVTLRLDAPVDAPADLLHEGRPVGTLTSSVTSPDGEHFGIGIIKAGLAEIGLELNAGANGTRATVRDFAGTPPPMVAST